MTPQIARVAGAAALAVILALPSAALADHGQPHGKDDNKETNQTAAQQDSDKQKGTATSRPATQKGKPADTPPAEKGKPADRRPAGDPAGNNGTIKIHPFRVDLGNANEPQPGCDFRLALFNFDDDQTGTITFVGMAPTADAVTAQPAATRGSVLLSDDPAGGGQDEDSVFDIRGSELGLSGAPANSGYHVKVLVDADDAPGGAKQKVFWLDCPAGGALVGGSGSAAITGTTEAAVSIGSFAVGTASAFRAHEAAEMARLQRTAADGLTLGSGTAAITDAGRVSGQSARGGVGRGFTLPFTGLPLAALLALAVVTLAGGALAVRAGRRRAVEIP